MFGSRNSVNGALDRITGRAMTTGVNRAAVPIRKATEDAVGGEFGRGQVLLARTRIVKEVTGDAINVAGYLSWQASSWATQQPGSIPAMQALLNISAMALCEIVDDTRP
jgi:hypothetical protein